MPNPDPYWRIKNLFAEALDRPEGERGPFLEAAAAGDRQVRDEVEALLQTHERAMCQTLRPDHLTPRGSVSPSFGIETRGTVIGPYMILELIGEGGMGVVYKAEQREPIRRIVALKLVKLGMDTKQVIARFEGERQALALMNHPNVAAVHDAGATGTGRPYFVMEYVPGTPITTFCDRNRYGTRQRLALYLQACEAIQHAHQKAIIHRDLKPGNILVMQDGQRQVVKVIDFGVAKATAQRLTERTLFTESGQLVGTPEYMSPEQADLNAVDVDTRSDIYSLGVVLYELLVGALPFDSKSLRAAAYAQIQAIIRDADPPRPSTRLSTMASETAQTVAARRGTEPSALARELRGELEWIPMKAMRKERAERYATASDLAGDIRNYLEHRPLLAGPESAAYQFRKFLRRRRGPVLAAAAVLLALVVGVIGTSIGFARESRQRAEAQRQEQEAKRQTAIADAVSTFQSNMLASADPNRMLGDKVTVLQAMTAAVKELDEGKLKDQPLVEARVRNMIGKTLRALGRFDTAEPNLRKALELRKAELPSSNPLVAESLGNLAMLLQEQGKYVESEPLFREALDQTRQAVPLDELSLAVALNNLALSLDHQAKYSECAVLYREALSIRRARLPAGDKRVARAMNNLAAVLYYQGKLDEAEPLYRESLELNRKSHPAGHPDLIFPVNNLSMLFKAQGRLAEAEALSREAVEIARKSLPVDHPDAAKTLASLGMVLKDQGNLEEAEKLFRESVAMCRRALPPGHPHTATAVSHLAVMLLEQKNYVEAEPMLRQVLADHRASLPWDHPQIALDLMNLGSALREVGRLDESQSAYEEARKALESKLGTEHVRLAAARIGLGRTLRALGQFSQAEAELLEACRVLEPAPNENRERCIEALIELYGDWNNAEPGKGHDLQAGAWAARLGSAGSATTRSSGK